MSTLAEVRMWGRSIGAVEIDEGDAFARFQFTPEFARSGIEVSPLSMPLTPRVYRFPELPTAGFHGLPGMLADALPDRYGNALIDAWLAAQGRTPESFNVVERLCYVGRRAMGALEFHPVTGPEESGTAQVQVDELVALASEILAHRTTWQTNLARPAEALQQILRVGASAGGARAKALIAWQPRTGEVRSGQGEVPDDFEHWLLKLDGIRANQDREGPDPAGYGAIEYAYHRMARDAGIEMTECRLLEEGGRRHFMTRRFDRTRHGRKLHLHTLAGIAHFDYNAAGAHSYEQAFQVIRRLDLGMVALEEQFRRMAFNIIARNQDDHVKNIAFLMAQDGTWSLSPAFDMTWSFNPEGAWTSTHQMSLNGKRDGFDLADFKAGAAAAGLKRGRAEALVAEVADTVRQWPAYATDAGVNEDRIRAIEATHRLSIHPY